MSFAVSAVSTYVRVVRTPAAAAPAAASGSAVPAPAPATHELMGALTKVEVAPARFARRRGEGDLVPVRRIMQVRAEDPMAPKEDITAQVMDILFQRAPTVIEQFLALLDQANRAEEASQQSKAIGLVQQAQELIKPHIPDPGEIHIEAVTVELAVVCTVKMPDSHERTLVVTDQFPEVTKGIQRANERLADLIKESHRLMPMVDLARTEPMVVIRPDFTTPSSENELRQLGSTGLDWDSPEGRAFAIQQMDRPEHNDQLAIKLITTGIDLKDPVQVQPVLHYLEKWNGLSQADELHAELCSLLASQAQGEALPQCRYIPLQAFTEVPECRDIAPIVAEVVQRDTQILAELAASGPAAAGLTQVEAPPEMRAVVTGLQVEEQHMAQLQEAAGPNRLLGMAA